MLLLILDLETSKDIHGKNIKRCTNSFIAVK